MRRRPLPARTGVCRGRGERQRNRDSSAEALPRIFNAFEQAERSITRQFGGLGLGLTISKALVEMHGGTIEAQSEGRDKGTTFRVRLPLTVPAGQPEAPSRAVPPQRARVLCASCWWKTTG